MTDVGYYQRAVQTIIWLDVRGITMTFDEYRQGTSLLEAANILPDEATVILRYFVLRSFPEAPGAVRDGFRGVRPDGTFMGWAVIAQTLRDELGDSSDEQRDFALLRWFGSDSLRLGIILMKAEDL